ncbi:MAG: tetratricopeptide repeat protein [Bryobacterales bacterium]|nr:tetratricopeptide repeat protein [Bryobacterales bacterium]
MSKLDLHDLYRLAEWGYGCYHQGDLERARVVFSALLELKPGDSYAARGLAAVALQQGKPEEAMQLMAQVLERNPADIAARARLVEALIDAGRLQEAQQGVASLRNHVEPPELARLDLRLRHALDGHATS